jgi:farnesyl diphosphate synthase
MYNSASLEAAMAQTAALVGDAITALLPQRKLTESALFDAMRWGCLSGGKRLRPVLVLQSAQLFGVSQGCALRVAAAVEFVHAYSLIHDDLPAMDDSDLRRGRPTVHKQFDEATAILAGDALLTLAFEVLGDHDTHEDPSIRCQLIVALARAAGPEGMVGGQMLDLIGETTSLDAGEVTRLQRLKTGALIGFSAESGGILGKASTHQRAALKAYAHDLGLAFQIADDLLDEEGTEAETGKPVGADARAGKRNFVSILGRTQARAQATLLAAQAAQHLDIFPERADVLRQLARYVVERRS